MSAILRLASLALFSSFLIGCTFRKEPRPPINAGHDVIYHNSLITQNFIISNKSTITAKPE
jgi:hypothetical protein